MRSAALFALVVIGGCRDGDSGSNAAPTQADQVASNTAAPAQPDGEAVARWDLQSSGEGTALALLSSSEAAAVRLFCPAAADRLLVNVSQFRAVGSEERMTFGSAGEVTTLVADSRGDAQRGGVSGAGDVPGNLAALVAGPISVNYGAQNSGPHPAPPADAARAFVAACMKGRDDKPRPSDAPAASASACLRQGDALLKIAPLRAVGTEPFWGARVEGRCVTYSHPDDQEGTRVWTRYAPGANGGGTWSGSLGGKRFELRTRLQAGCSDGMSDKRYPISVEILVSGEQRRGCAEPA